MMLIHYFYIQELTVNIKLSVIKIDLIYQGPYIIQHVNIKLSVIKIVSNLGRVKSLNYVNIKLSVIKINKVAYQDDRTVS